jgi:hypothetical protein
VVEASALLGTGPQPCYTHDTHFFYKWSTFTLNTLGYIARNWTNIIIRTCTAAFLGFDSIMTGPQAQVPHGIGATQALTPTSYLFMDVRTGRPVWVSTDSTCTKLRTFAKLKAVLKSRGIKQNKQVFDGLSDESYDEPCWCAGTCGKSLLTGGGRHMNLATAPKQRIVDGRARARARERERERERPDLVVYSRR